MTVRELFRKQRATLRHSDTTLWLATEASARAVELQDEATAFYTIQLYMLCVTAIKTDIPYDITYTRLGHHYSLILPLIRDLRQPTLHEIFAHYTEETDTSFLIQRNEQLDKIRQGTGISPHYFTELDNDKDTPKS